MRLACCGKTPVAHFGDDVMKAKSKYTLPIGNNRINCLCDIVGIIRKNSVYFYTIYTHVMLYKESDASVVVL